MYRLDNDETGEPNMIHIQMATDIRDSMVGVGSVAGCQREYLEHAPVVVPATHLVWKRSPT